MCEEEEENCSRDAKANIKGILNAPSNTKSSLYKPGKIESVQNQTNLFSNVAEEWIKGDMIKINDSSTIPRVSE